MTFSLRRAKDLFTYAEYLCNEGRERSVHDSYAEVLDTCLPLEVNWVIDRLVRKCGDYDQLEKSVARFIRACSSSLDRNDNRKYAEIPFFTFLLRDNEVLRKRLIYAGDMLRNWIAVQDNSAEESRARFLFVQALRDILPVADHYHLLQYPLFSALESVMEAYYCTRLLWHLQDKVLRMLRNLVSGLADSCPAPADTIDRDFGQIFALMESLVFREEKVLFPVAANVLPEDIHDGLFAAVSENMSDVPDNGGARDLDDDDRKQQRESASREIIEDMKREAAFSGRSASITREAKLPGHPVATYYAENRALRKELRKLKKWAFRAVRADDFSGLECTGRSVAQAQTHYERKEYQLFPFLEQNGFTGLSKIMWDRHDKIRTCLRVLMTAVEGQDRKLVAEIVPLLIKDIRHMIVMEEKILLPVAVRKLSREDWVHIRRGENAIGYAWIQPGNLWDPSSTGENRNGIPDCDEDIQDYSPFSRNMRQRYSELPSSEKPSRRTADS